MTLHCNNSSLPNLTSALSICNILARVICPGAIWAALKQAGPGCMCPLQGVGAGLVRLVGGCVAESCCEVGEAQLVHGVSDSNVRGCGWADAVVVGRGGVQFAYDDRGC